LNRSKDKLKNKEVLKQARGYSYQQPTNQMLATSPLSRKNRHSLSRFNRRQQPWRILASQMEDSLNGFENEIQIDLKADIKFSFEINSLR